VNGSVGITLTDARLTLEALLDVGGLPVMPHAGQLQAAPGAMVAAADPWVVPHPVLATLHRLSRWRVVLVAGGVDLEGTLDQLATMLALTDQALQAAPHDWSTERGGWSGPRQLPREGATYLVLERLVLIPVDLSTNPTPTTATEAPDV
jgi:hypothetical protein